MTDCSILANNARPGTAGWSIPRAVAEQFPEGGTSLGRYASRFGVVEINSSFHRPHRRATYARWASSVPEPFRFSVKLPKIITHQQRLVDCHAALASFAEQVAGLGQRRGPVLVQLPPSLVFEADVVEAFFALAQDLLGGQIVCEPRHASWFSEGADALLDALHVARVAADPAPVPEAAVPGGWQGLGYFRLHGAPRVYWSSYSTDAIAQWMRAAAKERGDAWVIFDNTASGAALANALQFTALQSKEVSPLPAP